MTFKKIIKRKQPLMEYKFVKESTELVDHAFDILFEVTLSESGKILQHELVIPPS